MIFKWFWLLLLYLIGNLNLLLFRFFRFDLLFQYIIHLNAIIFLLFHHHLHFHNHLPLHLHFHNHLHLHLYLYFFLFYVLLSQFLFCFLDFLILMFCQLKLYLINHWINLIIFLCLGVRFLYFIISTFFISFNAFKSF